jgi:F-type H+-transporting ATPase subunit delta
MSADIVVQKYSRALFEACEQASKTELVAAELAQAVAIFGQKEVADFFTSPFNSVDNKVMVAKSALEGKCAPELFNFFVTLAEKGRMALVSEMNNEFQKLVSEKSGQTEGVLYVASSVSDSFKAQVETKLSETMKKKVKLKVEKDPSLLAGFKVSVGGWTMDDSAQFHLNKIKDEISKRGI